MGATMGAGKRGEVRWKKPHLGPRLFVLPSQNVSASIQTTPEGEGGGGGANGCAVPQADSFPSTSTRLGTILPHQCNAPAHPAFKFAYERSVHLCDS